MSVDENNQSSPLDRLRIILVEPAGALNVGSTARIMRNMGLSRLIIVNPACDILAEEARRMAVHGIEVLENCSQVATLGEALQGCHRIIATTSKPRHLNTPLETPRTALPWLLTPNLESALIFGPEDRGLSNSELNHAQRFVGIPANPQYSSLNLALRSSLLIPVVRSPRLRLPKPSALCSRSTARFAPPTVRSKRTVTCFFSSGADTTSVRARPTDTTSLVSSSSPARRVTTA